MPDFRSLVKDTFVRIASPLVRRSLNRWIPSCPRNLSQWQHARVSYSWDGEDLMAESLLRRLGRKAADVFYVDVGCWHPINHSNTFLFYNQGASGIAVDPAPSVIRDFVDIRPRDVVIQAAVSESRGTGDYCCYEWTETNSLKSSNGTQENEFGHAPQKTIKVRTVRLSDILVENNVAGDFDLLDIDCEGHDLKVLRSNDWDRFRPRVILVEAHGSERQKETTEYLEELGYQLHALLISTMVFYTA